MPRNICSRGRVRKKCDVLVYTFLLLLLTVLIPSPVHNQEYTYHIVQIDEMVVEPSIDDVKAEIVRQARIYGVDEVTALRIAEAESNFKPKAFNGRNKNGSNDAGVFQINSIHKVPDECRFDYKCNIEWAMKMMKKKGTQPWYSSKHKWK